MPKFKCQNKNCQSFDKEELIPAVTFKWNNAELRFDSDYDNCPQCGERRITVKDYEGFTQAWFKAEGDRNYNNKKIKQYDYDRDQVNTVDIKIKNQKRKV